MQRDRLFSFSGFLLERQKTKYPVNPVDPVLKRNDKFKSYEGGYAKRQNIINQSGAERIGHRAE